MGFKEIVSKMVGNGNQQPQGGVVPSQGGVIGSAQIKEALNTLKDYKKGKTALETRIVENEEWWKLRHWEQIRSTKTNVNDPEPASAWLFNSIANKHADAMDNFPEPNVLPREASDKEVASMLSSIIPVILEYNEYEQTYSDTWWYKLKQGTGVNGVFWNSKLSDGLGDIDIKQLDLLNLFWEPGIKDIQKSRHFFNVELIDNDLLLQQYPNKGLEKKIKSSTLDIKEYKYDDALDVTKKSAVIDWYYHKTISEGNPGEEITREILHFCKFVNDTVLYATENDPLLAQTGLYDHGEYPFVFDTLFPVEGSPCGFGYVDIMRDPQMYIDKLNQIIMKNANIQGNPRYFISDDAGVSEEEFADPSKTFIHFTGRLGDDLFKQVTTQQLNGFVVQHLQSKVDEIKETSGNRDFSQGGTSSGVTAASAIAALQEAGSKLSRDMNKSSYRTHAKINYLVLENIRQFYDEPRTFRIVGESGTEFKSFDNSSMKLQPQAGAFGLEMGYRRPVFDIKITSQKASPFNKVAQNEFALELYGKGMFNPQVADQALIAFDMMDFENKDMVIQKVTQNAAMLQMITQMQAQMAQMAAIISKDHGVDLTGAVAGQAAQSGMQTAVPGQAAEDGTTIESNSLGEASKVSKNSTSMQAKERAMNTSKPKS